MASRKAPNDAATRFKSLYSHGFVRVAACAPVVVPANPDANAEAILKVCSEIDALESEADRVMRSAMSKLFRDEPDTRQLIKLKAIYELLETVTDRAEDTANVIEGIVLENA